MRRLNQITGLLMYAALAAALVGCNSEDDANCERIEVEGEDYCLYSQPITETGYDCPNDLSHAHDFGDGTVCSDREGGIPEEHHDPIEEEFDKIEESPDPSNSSSNSGGAKEGEECQSHDDCEDDSLYCKKAAGECDATGECQPIGDCSRYDCDGYCNVCGCDGETYGNNCEAEHAGVNIAYDGYCDGDECTSDEECRGNDPESDRYCDEDDQVCRGGEDG